MDKLAKDTEIFCHNFGFFGTIQGLREHVEDIGEVDDPVVTVEVTRKQPFMTVDDNWLLDLITREVERQGCDNERSSDSGNEMAVVEQLLAKHISVDYAAIMSEMPRLYYGQGEEIQIDLNDF